FEKTIAGVRVGIVDGNITINPTYAERKQSSLDLIVAGSADGILMVEAGAKEVTEAQVVAALEAAHAAIKQIVAAIDDLKKTVGKKKLTVAGREVDHALHQSVHDKTLGPLGDAMRILNKLESYSQVDTVLDDLLE